MHPRRLPDTLWGWVVPCLTYPEEDVIDEAGLDAAMYLRILKFGEVPCGGACPLALEETPCVLAAPRTCPHPGPCPMHHATCPVNSFQVYTAPLPQFKHLLPYPAPQVYCCSAA